jgi:nucleotide-binding universal stress UspA family protein
MSTILCATRGGKDSFPAQDAAIALAKEQGKPLLFLYVVDTGFLDHTERAVRPDVVVQEMVRMGEFLLTMARERAAAAGVPADIRVRQGDLRPELEAAVRDEQADALILGRPAGEESAFKLTSLESLAADIQEATGITVQLV